MSQPSHSELIARLELPDGPWQDLAVDCLGPLLLGDYIIVAIDYHSRWYEVDINKFMSVEKTEQSL